MTLWSLLLTAQSCASLTWIASFTKHLVSHMGLFGLFPSLLGCIDCPHINTVADVSQDFFENTDIESFGTGCSADGCASEISENWLCLVCHKVFCGRYANGHMLLHHAKVGHCVCMSFADLSVWCHGCDMYIDHDFFPKLHRFFSAMHRLKFTIFPPSRATKPLPVSSAAR